MTLPSSGTISMGDIRTELSASGTITLNDTNVRNLAGISSGTISLSNFYGKSNALLSKTLNYTIWTVYPARDYTGVDSSHGSISPNTSFFNNSTITEVYYWSEYHSTTVPYTSWRFQITTSTSVNSGWTTVRLGNYAWARTDFVFNGGRYYIIGDNKSDGIIMDNPFPSTSGNITLIFN